MDEQILISDIKTVARYDYIFTGQFFDKHLCSNKRWDFVYDSKFISGKKAKKTKQ